MYFHFFVINIFFGFFFIFIIISHSLIIALCVLPLNIINEKIYIALWFWFIFIAIMSGLSLIYRCTLLISPQVRLQTLRLRSRMVNFHTLRYVFDKCDIGDWFLLLQLARNIDPLTYKELIETIEKEISDNTKTFRISMNHGKEVKDDVDMYKIEKVDDLGKF